MFEIRPPKLFTYYHMWSNNMKAALQACLLWFLVEGLEDCPLKSSSGPLLDKDSKSILHSSTGYKDWIPVEKGLS